MKYNILPILQNLLVLPSPSGSEERITNAFIENIKNNVDEVKKDTLGNIIAIKKGVSNKKMMIVAHADEVGFMVTKIDERGFVSVRPIGGIDANLMPGMKLAIYGYNDVVYGVVGKKPIHLIKREERQQNFSFEDLWVDIGCSSKDSALSKIHVGDYVTYAPNVEIINERIICSKSLDDKVGLSILLKTAEILKDTFTPYDIVFVASVQEELGMRGARIVADLIKPDYCIVIDVTHATDYPSIFNDYDIKLNEGVVLAIGPNIDKLVGNTLISVADSLHIKYQLEPISYPTGTDANVIQITGSGVKTGLVSIPCRYMHTPVEMVSIDDIDTTIDLLTQFSLKNMLEFTFNDMHYVYALNDLHKQWIDILKNNHISKELIDCYVTDGIYPNYSNQKLKILFIAREILGLGGCDYIETLFNAFKNHYVGGKSLNKNKFFALQMYIAYGLIKNEKSYGDIPWANTIADTFGTDEGISFAFINISKFSNESKNWQSDYDLISKFLNGSSSDENMFAKEIDIINPDIIIGMNLDELYYKIGKLSDSKHFGNKQQVCLQKIATSKKSYTLIDCYHFSAPYKGWERDYFNPVFEAFEEFNKRKMKS